MHKRAYALFSLMAGLAAAQIHSQNLETPPPAASVAGPSRGLSMAQVEKRFGEPTQRVAAVGDPPISRWVYPDFVVYFEYSHVIHAVARRDAPAG